MAGSELRGRARGACAGTQCFRDEADLPDAKTVAGSSGNTSAGSIRA
jgi:hypothetical protein